MKKILKNKNIYLVLGSIVLLCIIALWLFLPSSSDGGLTCKSYGPNYEYKESKSCNNDCLPMAEIGDAKKITCCCPSDK